MNAEILAISVDDLSQASYAVQQLGLDFPILYDPAGDVVKSYGVLNQAAGYATPSTFIVDTEGAIQWEFIGTASHRTPSSEIIAQLQKLS